MTIHDMTKTGHLIVKKIDGQHVDECRSILGRKSENVGEFNDATVSEYHQNSASRIIQAYEDAHAEAADQLTRIPAEKLRQKGYRHVMARQMAWRTSWSASLKLISANTAPRLLFTAIHSFRQDISIRWDDVTDPITAAQGLS